MTDALASLSVDHRQVLIETYYRGRSVAEAATALSITHDMVSARKISDKIAMLYGGKIIWQGPTKEIDRSGNPYVEQFIHGRAEGPIKMAVKA